MTSLRERFGHEEQLSAALAASEELAAILADYGVTTDGTFHLEVPVKKGHDGHKGRVDVILGSNRGPVIVETQYGRADRYHAARLQNYASSVPNAALVVWVAESFDKKALDEFKLAKWPVSCVSVAIAEEGFALTKLTGNDHVKKSQAKRIAANRKKLETLLNKYPIQPMWAGPNEWFYKNKNRIFEDVTIWNDPETMNHALLSGPGGPFVFHKHRKAEFDAVTPKHVAETRFAQMGNSWDFVCSHPQMQEEIENTADEVAMMWALTGVTEVEKCERDHGADLLQAALASLSKQLVAA